MPQGPFNFVNLNPDSVKAIRNIAYQDEYGFWRAGPDSSITEGKSIPAWKAKNMRQLRRNANMVKNIMREAEQGQGMSREDAIQTAKEVSERLNDAEDEESRRDIWKEFVNS